VNIAPKDPTTTNQTSPNPTILHIWVFAPYLTISISKSDMKATQLIPASKVFYRPISIEEYVAMLESADMSLEEVQLPNEVMGELADTLRHSTTLLPESARKFRDWDVGFLERFIGESGYPR
jgi:hypothetical protein